MTSTACPSLARREAIALFAGRKPAISGQNTTPGRFAPDGATNQPSSVPSGVAKETSRPDWEGIAIVAHPAAPKASPEAAATWPNRRRVIAPSAHFFIISESHMIGTPFLSTPLFAKPGVFLSEGISQRGDCSRPLVPSLHGHRTLRVGDVLSGPFFVTRPGIRSRGSRYRAAPCGPDRGLRGSMAGRSGRRGRSACRACSRHS